MKYTWIIRLLVVAWGTLSASFIVLTAKEVNKGVDLPTQSYVIMTALIIIVGIMIYALYLFFQRIKKEKHEQEMSRQIRHLK